MEAYLSNPLHVGGRNGRASSLSRLNACFAKQTVYLSVSCSVSFSSRYSLLHKHHVVEVQQDVGILADAETRVRPDGSLEHGAWVRRRGRHVLADLVDLADSVDWVELVD